MIKGFRQNNEKVVLPDSCAVHDWQTKLEADSLPILQSVPFSCYRANIVY